MGKGRKRRGRRNQDRGQRGREFLPQVVENIFSSHPYEQPVVDVYPLSSGDTGLEGWLLSLPRASQEELEKKSLAFPLVAHYPDIDSHPLPKDALCPGSGKVF